MIELFTQLTGWHWAALGIILLILEALGAGGFLIGAAISSFITALFVIFSGDPDWKIQITLFSVLAVLLSIIYWYKFKNFNFRSDQPMLNDRAAQFIGRKFILAEAITNGQGRIQIGDTFWKLRSDDDLAVSTKIEVTGNDGMTLLVRAVD